MRLALQVVEVEAAARTEVRTGRDRDHPGRRAAHPPAMHFSRRLQPAEAVADHGEALERSRAIGDRAAEAVDHPACVMSPLGGTRTMTTGRDVELQGQLVDPTDTKG